MHRRKALMSSLSDGFLTLPGGYGTLEEFFETLTWAQLGLHKPCALLDVAGFWDDLLAMVDTQIGEGFARDEHRQLILSGEDPEELLDRMAARYPDRSDPVPGLSFDGPPVHRDLEPEPALDGNRSAKRAHGRDPVRPGARAAPPTRVIPRARDLSFSSSWRGEHELLPASSSGRLMFKMRCTCGTPGRDRSYTLRSNRNLPSDNRATLEANA